jgi:Ca2+-binding EF-hand superfamily protein
MSGLRLGGPLVLLASSLATLSAAAPAPTPPPDYQDFVFLASHRPVLLRIHTQVAGRPCTAAWDEFVHKLFAWLDRDGDGVLSQAEVERAPNAGYLLNHFQGALGLPLRGQTLHLADVDADKDGRVTPVELAAHYRRAGLGPVRLIANSAAESAAAVTDVLFRRLDADKDGKISAKEWESAAALLRPLDQNEDELLTASELSPGGLTRTVTPAPLDLAGRVQAARKDPHPVVPVQPGEPAEEVARPVLAHYDRDNDGTLSKEESGLDADAFAALDANRDGRLDAAEFAAFLRRPPDAELTARLGSVVAGDGMAGFFLRHLGEGFGLAGVQPLRIETVKGGLRLSPEAARRLGPQTLSLTLGDAALTLYVSDNDQPPRNTRQIYLQQFRLAAKKGGILERKKAMQVPFVSQVFDIADRDGDGKLTEKELEGWLDVLQDGAGSVAVLTATDQGRSLFELLDADGDGRLSPRELRTAWSRLRPHARDGAALAKADIPRRVQVTLGLGRQAVPARPTAGEPPSTPLWFRKMDRNNDGDVSRREFLGTEEDFNRLDLDRDGLISAEEARRAEDGLKKDRTP